ncbi:hypothetical protein CBL_00805 [Carabus blaptoides fortunei]
MASRTGNADGNNERPGDLKKGQSSTGIGHRVHTGISSTAHQEILRAYATPVTSVSVIQMSISRITALAIVPSIRIGELSKLLKNIIKACKLCIYRQRMQNKVSFWYKLKTNIIRQQVPMPDAVGIIYEVSGNFPKCIAAPIEQSAAGPGLQNEVTEDDGAHYTLVLPESIE